MKTFQLPICFMLAACITTSAFAPGRLSSRKELSKLSYKNLDDNEGEKVVRWNKDSIKLNKEKSGTKSSNINHATKHKKWGVDNENKNEYWFDSRIHTLGNVGFFGALHAATAPFATLMIDIHAYDGVDIRSLVAQELSKHVKTSQARVLDMCCGVGMSTRALQGAFPNAEAVIGVDTSSEMISMARFITKHVSVVQPWFDKVSDDLHLSQGLAAAKKAGDYIKEAARKCAASYTTGNAESTPFPASSFNLVTVMYAFHEAPWEGRERIIKEARRVLQPGGLLAVIDISSDYTPAESMLMGEPYVLEYQKNIHRQLKTMKGFAKSTYQTLIPGHVGMWVLQRS